MTGAADCDTFPLSLALTRKFVLHSWQVQGANLIVQAKVIGVVLEVMGDAGDFGYVDLR